METPTPIVPNAPNGSPITPIDPKKVRVHSGPIDREEQRRIEAEYTRSLIKKSGGKTKGAHGGAGAAKEIQHMKQVISALQACVLGMAEKYGCTYEEAQKIGALYMVRQVRSE